MGLSNQLGSACCTQEVCTVKIAQLHHLYCDTRKLRVNLKGALRYLLFKNLDQAEN